MEGLPVVKGITLQKDRKKGFGFTIERGEKTQGSSAVMVASIARGGPADLEGQLQVGDQILDVDGQKILGYAYEKVWRLVGGVWFDGGYSRRKIFLVRCLCLAMRTPTCTCCCHTKCPPKCGYVQILMTIKHL